MDKRLRTLQRVRNQCTSGEAKRIRLAARVSQSELAEPVGVPVPTISRWENGQRSPRGDAALRYARALDGLKRQLEREGSTPDAA